MKPMIPQSKKLIAQRRRERREDILYMNIRLVEFVKGVKTVCCFRLKIHDNPKEEFSKLQRYFYQNRPSALSASLREK